MSPEDPFVDRPEADRQTHRTTERQSDRATERQNDRATERQSDRADGAGNGYSVKEADFVNIVPNILPNSR